MSPRLAWIHSETLSKVKTNETLHWLVTELHSHLELTESDIVKEVPRNQHFFFFKRQGLHVLKGDLEFLSFASVT